jgi:tubulin-specific chaperone C
MLRVLIGACCDTVSVRDCVDCTITVGCKKLRCKNCTFYLCCSSESIIENCEKISVAPFNAAYDGLTEQFLAAGLDPSANVWFEGKLSHLFLLVVLLSSLFSLCHLLIFVL